MFQLGVHTLSVPASLHSQNRRRLVDRLRSKSIGKNGVIVLQGGETKNMYCTDVEVSPHLLPFKHMLISIS